MPYREISGGWHAANRYQDDMLYNWSKQKGDEGCVGIRTKRKGIEIIIYLYDFLVKEGF